MDGHRGAPPTDAAQLPLDLSEAIRQTLHDIYEGTISPEKDLQPEMFSGIWETLNIAAAKGYGEAGDTADAFLDEIRHNTGVFAAFKVHSMQHHMAGFLTDSDGRLRSFDEWREDAAKVASHHCGAWLRTEYDTAVKRAHQAAEWHRFEAERDVLPNLRWVPSTAVEPDSVHRQYWGIVRPIGDAFWDAHKPGDRWGCQCSLEATDDPVTRIPADSMMDEPSPGLDNNPGKDGKLFSDTHPYFPKDCSTCPFRNGTASVIPTNKVRDCTRCAYLKNCIDNSGCKPDKEYGQRLLISNKADARELKDNIRAAKAILSSFPEDEIQIRRNVNIDGVKNPEYLINKLLADRKGIRGENGIASGFSKALKQGCSSVVIDLDMNMSSKNLNSWELAKHIQWRNNDFLSGKIVSCYVIYHNKAVKITAKHFSSDTEYERREAIATELKQLKPQ